MTKKIKSCNECPARDVCKCVFDMENPDCKCARIKIESFNAPCDAETIKRNSINSELIKKIVDNLNINCGTAFRPTAANTQKHINARLNDGFKLEDFYHVISYKADEWNGDPHMCQYLRPDTLFGTKFESYLQAAKRTEPQKPTMKTYRPELSE